MTEEKLLGSITARVSFEMISFLVGISGRGKRFKDRSEALRHYFELGKKTEAIMELKKDPERQKEFNEKFSHLMGEQNLQKIAETMDEKEIEAAIFYLENMKSKKIQQLLDNVKKS